MKKFKQIDFGIGQATIYEHYLIMIINQGETVHVKCNTMLLDTIDKFYKNKKFVYITHRLNSYAVNPAVYHETQKIENLIGFAVVSNKEMDLNNAKIEKLFFNKPFEIFSELDEAILWAEKLYEQSVKP